MLHRIREQFSTAALILSVVALVAALAGGAIAASHSDSIASKSKVGPRGPRGPKGAPGAPGTNGANGTAGAKGENGAPGAPGASVVLGSAPSCEEGGTSVEVAGSPSTKRAVCDGIEGPPGPRGEDGEPGEPGENGQTGFTETLPSGQTETGAWISPFIQNVTELYAQVAVSFPIPLAASLEGGGVHYVSIAAQTAHSVTACPGTVEAPTATKANFCVYQGVTENPTGTGSFGVTFIRRPGAEASGTGTAGAVMYVAYEGEASSEYTWMSGSWAVTGP
jgi:hypothetical protein